MIRQGKATGLRYKYWSLDKKSGDLKVWFDKEMLAGFVEIIQSEIIENKAITGEIFIILTNEPKKES